MKSWSIFLVIVVLAESESSFSRTMFKIVNTPTMDRKLSLFHHRPLARFRRALRHHSHPSFHRHLFSHKSLHRRTQLTPANPTSININTQNSLDDVVQSSIKNSLGTTPQIIIINQPLPIGTEGQLRPLNTYDFDQGNYITGQYPPANGIIRGPITAYEIDGLMTMLHATSNLYSSFYDMLPVEQPSISPNDKTLNVLEFYGKVRAFLNGFVAVQSKLRADISFASQRLLTLRLGQDSMLRFYGFASAFDLLRQRSIVYESRDASFKVFANNVLRAVETYNNWVNRVLSQTYSLQKLSSYFTNEISQLQRQDSPDNTLFVVDKFNDVLMFVVQVLDVRSQLLGSLTQVEQNLLAAKANRRSFEGLLTQIDQKVTSDETVDAANLSVNSTSTSLKRSHLWKATFILLFVYFNQ